MHRATPECLDDARDLMRRESEAIAAAAERLDARFVAAVDLLAGHKGNVVVTGIGKSGLVGRKLAATFRSTGTRAVFLHPSEALHGDLGIFERGDPTVLISKSGATAELLALLDALRQYRSPLIGILGDVRSPLARQMDAVLDASVWREADPDNLAPTASAAVALAMGHALAVAVMRARGFQAEDFARTHPGGQLGRNLNLRVGELMHTGGEVAWARPGDPLKQVVIAMSERPLGAACVVSDEGRLLGLITDGDLRRVLRDTDDIRLLRAADVMTTTPVVVGPDAPLHEALRLMEDRPSQISLLPVVEPAAGRCLGLVRLHDAYAHRM